MPQISNVDRLQSPILRLRILSFFTYGAFAATIVSLALLPLTRAAKNYYALPDVPWKPLEILYWTVPPSYVEWLLAVAGLGIAALMIPVLRLNRVSVVLSTLLILAVCGFAIGSIVYFESQSRALVEYSESVSAAVIVLILALLIQLFLARCLWTLVLVVRRRQQAFVLGARARGWSEVARLFTLPVYFGRLPLVRKCIVTILGLVTIYFFAQSVSRWSNLSMSAMSTTESTITGAVNGCLRSAKSAREASGCVQLNDFLRAHLVVVLFVISLTGPFLFLFIARGSRLLQELASRTNIDAATRYDSRAPVLYLRPFGMESLKVKKAQRDPLDWLFDVTDREQRLDQIVLDEMTAVGPVVGLGNPRDTWQPTGIAREYAADGDWKERVSTMISTSKRIVVTIDDTPNMLYELDEIGQRQRIADTLFLFPPGLNRAKAEHLIGSIQDKLRSKTAISIPSLTGGVSPLGFWFTAAGDIHLCVSRSYSADAYRASIRGYENLRSIG